MKAFLFFLSWIAIGISFGMGFREVSKSIDWIGIIFPGIAYFTMFTSALLYKDEL